MKKMYLFSLLFISILSCKKDNDDPAPNTNNSSSDTLNLGIKDFIWKGLNSYYLWQSDVSNLADNRFASNVSETTLQTSSYVDFLNGYNSPDALFYGLLYKYEEIDRFSFITEDYTELERSFQGISLSTGMDFVLSRYGQSDGVLGIVRYVIPGSSAEQQGVKRGDIFLSVDGTALNLTNYQQLLFNDKTSMTIDINYVERINGSLTIVSANNTVTMTKTEITENPILIKSVFERGNKKIAYLMYNSFVANFDEALNEAFGEFKNQGVTDLVLDLRYNGGGRISSAIYLASMITGQFTGQVFAKERYNSKLQPLFKEEQITNYFVNKIYIDQNTSLPLNSLNLSKVYILTTERTASASELVINGLKPYIDVVQIGGVTTGKNQGSITLYDSPSGYDKNGINPNHKWAMQPLVLKIENSAGVGDYTNGLTPNISIEEDLANFGVLGNENEPFLSRAIQAITGTGKYLPQPALMPMKPIVDSKSFNFAANEMYK
ncbi:MAG: S41 family peptidase [Capnocytophaga sp.]|nr:S41 family peptidase [Capnocytophaga sp.]